MSPSRACPSSPGLSIPWKRATLISIFNRLGAVARTYLVNHYGILEDGLNNGLESDRFEVEQWLTSARVQTLSA